MVRAGQLFEGYKIIGDVSVLCEGSALPDQMLTAPWLGPGAAHLLNYKTPMAK